MNRTTALYGDSLQTVTSVYDPVGNLLERRAANPWGFADYEYWVYDENGNPTYEKALGGLVRTFSYDALDRITQQTPVRHGVTTYSYDAAGNVNSNESGPKTTYYNLAGQIASMMYVSTPTTYTYDDNGNLVKIDGRLDGGADFGVVTMAYD
ncbi:MAG: hypothetical protein KF743_01415 [Fimbriimonadaceae bacterium]|nr:hypothetical protein [Fimbriimonadaceae bacterium]